MHSNYWELTINKTVKVRVVYESELDEDAAIEAYLNDDIYDILDESDSEAEEVIDAVPLKG